MEFEIQPKSVNELAEQLVATGVQTNKYAQVLLESNYYDPAVSGRFTVELVNLSDLGFDEPATLQHVYERAQATGYCLCPLELAPYARMQWLEQAQSKTSILSGTHSMPDSAVNVATPVLSEDHTFPKGFYLRVVDGVPWLRGYRCDDTYLFPLESCFMFVLPPEN
ncbi:hypothetical protein ACN08Y_02545 [Rothia sp. P5764]|uniref:hypothetical protein n=1 Tax=unclassified Rothia (in: high G+C Gram-positive bacteria) TaxID=2689056 RepID=UPI003AC6131D